MTSGKEKNRVHMAERRKRLIESGLCAYCGKTPPREGRRECGPCSERSKSYARSYYQASRTLPEKRDKTNGRQKSYRMERLARGTCGICGKVPPRDGRQSCQECADKNRGYQRRHKGVRYAKIRDLVLGHYGRSCSRCGFPNQAALEIHHVEENGNTHRRDIQGGSAGGSTLPEWIVKHDFPEGFEILCANCHSIHHRSKSSRRTETVSNPLVERAT